MHSHRIASTDLQGAPGRAVARAEYPPPVEARRGSFFDAGLYAGSAAAASIVAAWAGIPLFREWGRLAIAPYAAGCAIAVGLSLRAAPERSRSRALSLLAVAVLAGAAILPLALEATWRARTGPGLHAQSEAIVTEEAARALRRGEDPYAATYLHGPLAARPLGTKTHFPYLPGMLAFGQPRALDGSSPLADARVAFAGFTLAAGALALARPPLRRTTPERRRATFLVLAVLPTGALLMATGGDDLPVLALMLLSLVLADEGRPWAAGAAVGAAGAMKQTAWILLPFLALAIRDGGGRRAPARFSLAAGTVVAAAVIPFVAWDAGAFVEDVVRFPLGLGRQRSAAGTPTLGTALLRAFPSFRTPLTLVLIALVLALLAFILLRRPPSTPSAAARDAGLVFLAGLLLAPAARFGYVVYPIDLLVWAWALDAAKVPAPFSAHAATTTDTRLDG
jgi:glycosyl transferase family 87